MKRILCTLLLAAMLLPTLAACSGNEGTPAATAGGETTTAAETEKPADPFEGLKEADLGGYSFRMLIRPNNNLYIPDMIAETTTGEILNDSVYDRNSAVAERYNVEFKWTPSSNSNYETDAKPIILAGDDAYDLVLPHMRAAHLYGNEGLILDWNKQLPNIRLDGKWWSRNARESFSINHKLYVMMGDISWLALGSANALYFNKKLFSDLGLETPYKLCADGKWTWDRFEAMVRGKGLDLNGDGKLDIDNDRLGYVTSEYCGPMQVFVSSGLHVIEKDKDDIPYISFYNDRTVQVFEKFFGLIDSGDAYCTYTGMPYTVSKRTAFTEDRALFLDMALRSFGDLRAMESDFGIIPWPKWEESEPYLTNVDGSTHGFTVPLTIKDPDAVSLVIEALCVYGSHNVIPAFYETTLKGKTIRDPESEVMLDIIHDSLAFDLGYDNSSIATPFGDMFFNFVGGKNGGNLTSFYESNIASAQKKLADALAAPAYR